MHDKARAIRTSVESGKQFQAFLEIHVHQQYISCDLRDRLSIQLTDVIKIELLNTCTLRTTATFKHQRVFLTLISRSGPSSFRSGN